MLVTPSKAPPSVLLSDKPADRETVSLSTQERAIKTGTGQEGGAVDQGFSRNLNRRHRGTPSFVCVKQISTLLVVYKLAFCSLIRMENEENTPFYSPANLEEGSRFTGRSGTHGYLL